MRCLSEFAFRGVNLTRIESRPRKGRLGHYLFLVDIDGRAEDPPVADAIAALGGHCEEVRVLGQLSRGVTRRFAGRSAPAAPLHFRRRERRHGESHTTRPRVVRAGHRAPAART